jgi:tetratricopeptide (TPR) repeat protein
LFLAALGCGREGPGSAPRGAEAGAAILPEPPASRAETLAALAALDLEGGRPVEAAARYLQILAIRKDLGDRAGEAAALRGAAEARLAMGWNREAMQFYEAAYRIARGLRDRATQAAILRTMGRMRCDRGGSLAGQEDLRGALGLYQDLGDEREEAATLEALGRVLTTGGHPAEARAFLDESLEIRRRLGDRAGEGRSLAELALLDARLFEFDACFDRFARARRIAREIGDRRLSADILSGLGSVRRSRGDLREALRLEEEALSVRREIGDRRGEATSLGSLGAIHQAIGDAVAARKSLGEGIEAMRALANRAGEAGARSNLGVLLEDGRDFAGAEREYRAAALLRESVGYWTGRARCRLDLARVLMAQGRLAEGRETVDRAIEAFRDARDRGGTALALIELGDLERRAGRPEAALARYREALDLARAAGVHESVWRAEAGRAAALAVLGGWRDALAGYGKAMEDLESYHARSDPERLEPRRAEDGTVLYEEAVRLLWEHQGEIKDAGDRGRAIAERSRALEMRKAAPRHADIVLPAPRTAARAPRDRIGPRDVLLEYLVGEEASYLWESRGGGVRWWRLPARSDLEPRVRNLLELLRSEAADLGPEPAYREAARALGRTLLPGAPFDSARQLLIVPDGILHHLPFETLVLPAESLGAGGRETLVIEEHEVVYAPSVAAPRVPGDRDDTPRPGHPTLLAFGDPLIDPDPAAAGQAPPLPFAREEVRRIAALFPEADRAIRLGPQACEPSVKATDIARFQYVHFATPGLIDETAPGRSGLLLGTGCTGGDGAATERGGADDEGADDGVLTVNEILRLRLDADLAVVSRCRSVVGDHARGEGLTGVTRAFLQAGARAVVIGLWSADDRSTIDLMETMYRGLMVGESPAAALRRAKLASLRAERGGDGHPSRWAPFVLTADPGGI